MIDTIKELRVKIDGLYQLTKELKPFKSNPDSYFQHIEFNSKEVNKATDSLLMAKAWLGKLLGELGSDNPYSSGKKTIEDIEPIADVDVNNTIFETSTNIDHWGKDYAKFNHIEKVDWLRSRIQDIISDISKWYTHTPIPTREIAIARTNSYNYLCEAKMWLGFEFARIRDNEE